jgi:hypothetical protein
MSRKTLFVAILFAGSFAAAPQAQATTGIFHSGVSFGGTNHSTGSYSGSGKSHTVYGEVDCTDDKGSGSHGGSSGWSGKPKVVVKTKGSKTFHFGSFKWDHDGKGHSIPDWNQGGHNHFPGDGCGDDHHHGGDGDGDGDGGNEGGEGGGTPAVPEPASWALMILGFGAIGATQRGRGAVRFA